MPAAETARLIASLELKDQFSKPLGAAEGRLGSFDRKLSDTSNRAYRAGTQIGTGIKAGVVIAATGIGILASQVAVGLNSLVKLDDVVTQTNAVLKSTKGAAGENAKAIRDLANKYEDLNATIDDTVIQSGENLLLTFTNIRKQAFEPTLKAALDMNQALGGGEAGLRGTIQRLGKALNDPIKGLSQLGRVGVTFTKSQKDAIKAAVKAGDTFKAQGIILAELNKRFGGSFLAGGATTTGKIAKFKDAIDDLQRTLATALLPVIGKVADRLSTFLNDPKVISTVNDLGNSIAGLFSDQNLAEGGKILGTFIDTARAAAPVIRGAAEATLGIVKAAVGLFRSLPEGIQQLAIGAFAINKLTGGLVTNVAGGLISAVISQFKPLMNVNAGVVNVNGAAGGIPGAVGAASGGVGGLIKGTVQFVLPIGLGILIANAIREASGLTPEDSAARQNTGQFGPRSGSNVSAIRLDDRQLDSAALRAGTNIADRLLDSPLGKISPSTIAAGVKDGLSNEFHAMIVALKDARKPEDVAKAVRAAVELVVGKGRGAVDSTKDVLATLRRQLANTDSPKLRTQLVAAINAVQKKVVGREFVARQIALADKVAKSSESTKDKIRDLTAIEKTLQGRSTNAIKEVQAKIDTAKRATVAAQHNTSEAIRRKRLSVTTYITTPPVVVHVSGRDVFTGQKHTSKYFATVS